jgi:hypothetical protein
MTAPATPLAALAGRWQGTSRLVLPWNTPPESDSSSTAEVRVVAGGRFVTIAYTWEYEGKANEGFLLFGREKKTDAVHAAWVDSWHQGDRPLDSDGTVTADGGITVLGHFPAPPGPDWGWRTVVEASGDDAFRIAMYTIEPGSSEETLGFENRYVRAS